jgi:hypothetical protein
MRRYDARHNDTQHNGIQHYRKYKATLCNDDKVLSVIELNVVMLSVAKNPFLLSVAMPNVVMPSVVAPLMQVTSGGRLFENQTRE